MISAGQAFRRGFLLATAGVLSALAATAAAPPVHDEADPVETLAQTRKNREVFDESFGGFKADLHVEIDGAQHTGTVVFRPPITLEVKLEDKDVRKTVKSQIRSMLMHRTASSGSSDESLTFAEADGHPLGRRIKLGDKYDSSYRILDGEIREVDRWMPEHHLVITVLETEKTANWRYLPTRFMVSLFDRETGNLEGVDIMEDSFERFGNNYVPTERRTTSAHEGKTEAFLIKLDQIELLPAIEQD